jgi:hypothetical protein
VITFSTESLDQVIGEVNPLLELHYQELCMNKEVVKLDPIWPQYRAVEQAGKLAIYTVRDEGDLVGYAAFFVTPHMHYAGLMLATNDVLFLRADYRLGTTGTRFVKHCASQLKTRGAHKIAFHIKLSLDWSPILTRIGYAIEEITVAKLL